MDLNIWLAFGAGFLSFISPCCLPLYPSYLSYITGISVTDLKAERRTRDVRIRTMVHTFFFMIGFCIVFYTLSYGTSAFGDFFRDYERLIRQISAIMIIVLGLVLVGFWQPRFLMKERKMDVQLGKKSYLGSIIFGIGFSAGWSPCVGPILSAILLLAATNPGTWFQLTTAYALGFAIPFFVLAFFIGSTRWILKYSSTIMKIGGGVMILMGILLFTDQMSRLTVWLNQFAPDWLG
ncbi:cytochrome c biogenesis CcdA family protein [Paenibacillus daejeonensis]|uniref:cytochrome c biogenesis CcdA family protein n=1 Tax=Paenibacillus daejeonensis TaxID=135193 RepID=UPI00035D17B2|nr:cytochrome c biogenesis protein CcdA [Paenibacillus daejeonensis]